MFNRKPLSEDFVTLKNGRKVLFYELTHGILNKVTTKATTFEDKVNNSKFFTLMEYELVKLKKKELFNLPLSDGNKIRDKVREILKRHKILTIEEEEVKQFSPQDINWLNKTKIKQMSEFKG